MVSPETVTEQVLTFCKTIYDRGVPRYIPVRTEPGNIPGECFYSCRRHNAKTGSAIVWGWVIWELKGKMLEAEHHSVVELSGEMFCVSPHPERPDHILFLPDPSVPFDFSDRRSTRESKFLNISGFKLVDELIRARLEMIRFVASHQDRSGGVTIDPDELERLEENVRQLLLRIKRKP
jgi:hypothetical protein